MRWYLPQMRQGHGWLERKDSGLGGHPRAQQRYREIRMAGSPRDAPAAMDSILEAIGATPLVRLRRIEQSQGLACELYGKCEFLNAGGSVKDRIGLRMVLDAEASGKIRPGDTLIEPTSGNTGIGLALVAAVRGYRSIITLPEKMSEEKVNVLKALGAEIVRTPTEAPFDSPESHIGVARRLHREIPNSHILDQYCNPSNPEAHFGGTATEILSQLENRVDMIVCGVGTGGTITGIARKVKEIVPTCLIIGVDPQGSILAQPENLNEGGVFSYKVEGIGYDFVPDVLERALVDRWIKTDDHGSFLAARQLIREEGLLVGGSSGSALIGALEAARQLRSGERCVVILPDSCRNYMSKFMSDQWMERHDFSEPSASEAENRRSGWADLPVASLPLQAPMTVLSSVSCEETVQVMHQHGIDQVPVVEEDGEILGVVTEGTLMSSLVSRRLNSTDPVKNAAFGQFRELSIDSKLSDLERIFRYDHFALIVTRQSVFSAGGVRTDRKIVVGVVTHIDLLRLLVSITNSHSSGES
mmetsp:Transcript_3648/g.6944  ORF Transcript_3648/g.6944 Transcript_3648/m.6944 type:complete len:529 (+) Transcript_3648:170-1756(+)